MARCPRSAFPEGRMCRAVRAPCADAGKPPSGDGAGRVPSPGSCHRTHERNLMNKAELVSAIAKRADVPAATVDSVLAGLQDELVDAITRGDKVARSEEHTSELQSRQYLVCRLLLEK